MPAVETGATVYVGINDSENPFNAKQIFGENSALTISSIKDHNGNDVAYSNGLITLPSLTAGAQYTWTFLSGGVSYSVNVFAATNVIRDIDDFKAIFESSSGKAGYYVLANNIDATTATFNSPTDGVSSWACALSGTFDGRGFTVDGLTVKGQNGIFGVISGGTLKNVAFTNLKIQNTQNKDTFVLMTYGWEITIDNVFIGITQYGSNWNALYGYSTDTEKTTRTNSITNMMVVSPTWANTRVLDLVWNNQASNRISPDAYSNVYVISANDLSYGREDGVFAGVTKYADVATFKQKVNTATLTGFNEYWDLSGEYPVFVSSK